MRENWHSGGDLQLPVIYSSSVYFNKSSKVQKVDDIGPNSHLDSSHFAGSAEKHDLVEEGAYSYPLQPVNHYHWCFLVLLSSVLYFPHLN